jgi:hypothetical protein
VSLALRKILRYFSAVCLKKTYEGVICFLPLCLAIMRILRAGGNQTVVKCDKHPAYYCVIFYGSEVVLAFNFVVGAFALRE